MVSVLLVPLLLPLGTVWSVPSADQNSGYECQYLSSHKELSCQCTKYNINLVNLAHLVSSVSSSVESLKVSECVSVDLSLDLVSLSQPFYQVRVENAHQVRLHGVRLLYQTNLDIIIRNIKNSLDVFGHITCVDCTDDGGGGGDDVRHQAQPTLILQVKNTTNASLHYLDIGSVNLRLSARNVQHLYIAATHFHHLAENAIEVWYSRGLEITNSIVRNSQDNAIVVNHVDKVRLHNTVGILNSSLLLMSDLTRVEMMCTAEYTGDSSMKLLSWSEQLCSPLNLEGLQTASGGHNLQSSSKTATILLTAMCGVVVFIVILVLCYLNKAGKLHTML